MRIVCISDTHNRTTKENLPLPDGDVLIHAGDHTSLGDPKELEVAAQWLGSYKDQFKHILTIAGNHDFICEHSQSFATRTFAKEGIKYLHDTSYKIDNVMFYGSPWQPWFGGWAFNFPQFDAGLIAAKETWNDIPNETQVLITHGPPANMLDRTLNHNVWDTRVGCPELANRILQLEELRLHVFGHIHESNGLVYRGDIGKGTVFINAAICDRERYSPNQPYHAVTI